MNEILPEKLRQAAEDALGVPVNGGFVIVVNEIGQGGVFSVGGSVELATASGLLGRASGFCIRASVNLSDSLPQDVKSIEIIEELKQNFDAGTESGAAFNASEDAFVVIRGKGRE